MGQRKRISRILENGSRIAESLHKTQAERSYHKTKAHVRVSNRSKGKQIGMNPNK